VRRLLCVLGRHDWRTKYDNEGRPIEICGRPGVITLEATLDRTDHTPEPTPHRGHLNHARRRVRLLLPGVSGWS
jgi:hypothetical protein